MSHDQRSEQPTPTRRDEARAEGRVARSREVVAAGAILAGFLALDALGSTLWSTAQAATVQGLNSLGHASESIDVEGVVALAAQSAISLAALVLPVAGTMLFTVVGLNVIQGGVGFRPAALTPRLSRIDPLQGVQRIVGPRAIARGIFAILKITVVGWLLWSTLVRYVAVGPVDALGQSSGLSGVLVGTWKVVVDFGVQLGAALVSLATLDYVIERWIHERSLRMTSEEVRDESNSLEGDPGIKRQRRQMWLKMIRGRPAPEGPSVDPTPPIDSIG